MINKKILLIFVIVLLLLLLASLIVITILLSRKAPQPPRLVNNQLKSENSDQNSFLATKEAAVKKSDDRIITNQEPDTKISESELDVLKNYLQETKNIYGELKNKFIWAKTNSVKPSDETSILTKYIMDYNPTNKEVDEFHSKLPWGGWSNQWSIKRNALRKKLDLITPNSHNGIEMKTYIQIALDSLIFLRSDYSSILDGKNIKTDNLIKQIEEAIEVAERVLSINDLIKAVGDKEKTLIINQSSKGSAKADDLIKEQKIIIDLIQGQINNRDIRNSLTANDVIRIMGKQPEDKEYNVYSYYSDGIEFMINTKTQKCIMVSIYLNNVKINNPLVEETWSYQPFKYKVLPINGQDNIQSVISKLGKPEHYDASTLDGSPRVRYKTSYGAMYIYFNKDEKADQVDLSFD